MFTAILKIKQSSLRTILSLTLTLITLGAWAQAPNFVSAQVAVNRPDRVVVTFDNTNMATTNATGFDIKVNTVSVGIAGTYSFNGEGVPQDEIWFTLNTPIKNGDAITISYDGSGDARRFGATFLGAFAAQSVTNNVAAISVTPAHSSTNIAPGANLTIDFNTGTNLVKGTSKDITLTPVSPAGTPVTIAVSSGEVSLAGSVVTINPTADLSANTLYDISFPAETFLADDVSGDVDGDGPLTGIATTEWRFTTGANLSVTAPSLTNICSGANSFFSLGDIIINEGSNAHFATGAGQTLILDAPTNFEFEAGTGSVAHSGADVTASSVVITNNQITVTYTVATQADVNTLTISGIKVKATTTSASGNIARSGGTATQTGNAVGDALVHASLSADANNCPEVNTYTPAHIATGVAIGDNLNLDFNGTNIIAGTGSITITPISPAGTPVIIPIGDAQITIGSGSDQVVINPSSDLVPGTQYQVTIPSGVILADGTNAPYTGRASGEWTFTTADVPLTITTYSPLNGSGNLDKTSNIVLTYSTNIQANTGNIVIRNTTDGVDEFTIPIGDPQITISGNILTINPATDLNANKAYEVTMLAGVVQRFSDASGGPALTSGTYVFSTAITITGYDPTNGSVDIATTYSPAITYDAVVKKGAGGIKLQLIDLTDGTSTNTNIGNNTLTYGTTATFAAQTLEANTLYEIIIPTGAIVADGRATSTVPAVATTQWRFTTVSGITGTPATPAHNNNAATVGLTTLTINYSGAIREKPATTANITLTDVTDGTSTQSIAVSSANVNVSGSTVTITVSALEANTAYTVAIPGDAFEANAGANAAVPEITTSQWAFTTSSGITGTPATPAHNNNAATVGLTTLTINYSGAIREKPATTANITLTDVTDGTSTQSIAVSSANVNVSGSTVTITVSALEANTAYTVAIPGDAFEANAGANAAIPEITTAQWAFTTSSGITGTPATPAHNDNAVTIGLTTLTINYSGAIREKPATTANITLTDVTDGTSTQSIAVNSANVSVGGSTVTITVSALEANTAYTVAIPGDAFEANAGANAAIPEITTSQWAFTTSSGITGTPATPAHNDNAATVGLTTLTINYSGAIREKPATTANITLTDVTDGTSTQSIAVSSANVNVSGSTVTITVSALEANTAYTVAIPGDAFEANAGANATIPEVTTSQWAFTTKSAITISSITPADNTTDVATSANLVINFSANVRAGTGDIIIENVTDGSTLQNIAVGTASFSGSQVTVSNVSFTLLDNTAYKVTFADGVILDDAGANGYVTGITDGNNWSFTTASGISTAAFDPLNAATNVAVGANLKITFSGSVQRGTGNVYVKDVGTGITTPYDITNTGIFTFPSGAELLINLTADLNFNTTYEITMDKGALKAAARAAADVPAIIAGTWQFTTIGGATVTAPSLTACIGADFVTLNPIVITESTNSSFSAGATQTLSLSVPANYALDPGVGSIIVTGTEISNSSITVVANKITIQYDISGTDNINSIIITGIRIKANAAGAGNIVNDGTGSAVQQGNVNGTTHASLTTVNRPSVPAVTNATFTFCQNENISASTVTASGGGTYTWYSDAALNNQLYVGATPNLATNLGTTTTNDGVTTYYVTRNDGTCESTATTVTVTVNPEPVVSLVSSDLDNIICFGEAITFTAIATPNTGATYHFKLGTNTLQNTTSNTYTSSTLPTGTDNVTVEVTVSGCLVISSGISLTVNTPSSVGYEEPTVTSFSVEQTAAVSLSDGTTYGGTIDDIIVSVGVGSFSGTGVIDNKFYPDVAGVGTWSITYTYTNVSNCTSSTSFNLTVFDPNGAITGLNNSYCLDDPKSGVLTPNLSGFPNYIYKTKTKTKTQTIGSCPFCFTVKIPVVYQATYIKSSGPTLYTITGTGIEGAYPSYQFNPNSLGTRLITTNVTYNYVSTAVIQPNPFGSNPSDPSFSPTKTEPKSVSVSVNQLPVLVLGNLTENQVLCKDVTSYVLDPRADGASVNTNFTLYLVTGAITTPYNNIKTINPSALTAGTYQAYFTYTGTGCTETSSITNFEIADRPDLDFKFPGNADSYTVCENITSVAVSPTDGGSGISGSNVIFEVQKKKTGPYIQLGAGITIIDPSVFGVGTHNVRFTYTNVKGCSITSTPSKELTVNALPVLTFGFGGSGTSYCFSVTNVSLIPKDGGVDIPTSPTNNDIVFEIDQDSDGSYTALPNGTVSFNPQSLGVGIHQIRFTYTNASGCSTTSSARSITVLALPDPNFAETSLTACENVANLNVTLRDGTTNLIGVQLNAPTTVIEIDPKSSGTFGPPPGGSVTINTGTSTVTLHPNVLGATDAGQPHLIRFTYINADGCVETSSTISLDVYALPNPQLTMNTGTAPFAYCVDAGQQKLSVKDGTNDLSATQLLNDATFEIDKGSGFTNNNGEVVVSGNEAFIVPNVLGASGTAHKIRFTYKNADGCEKTSGNLEVTINALPVPVINSIATGYCTDASTATLTLQDGGSNITINTGGPNVVFEIDAGRTGVYSATLPAGSITLTNGTNQVVLDPTKIPVGQHNFRYQYTDANGCIAYSVGYPVEIFDLPKLSIIGLSSAYCIDNADVTLRTENGGTDLLNDLANVVFSISSNGGATYGAAGAVVDVNTVAKTITFKPSLLLAGNYKVRFQYTDGNACSDYSTPLDITIHPLPDPTVTMAAGTGPFAYCVDAGQQLLLVKDGSTALTAAELLKATFEIDKGSGFATNNGEVVVSGNQVFIAPDVLEASATVRKIRFTYINSNTCVKTSANLEVTINALPVPVINSIATGYCTDASTATLTLQDGGSNITINTGGPNVVFEIDVGRTGTYSATLPAGSITPANGTNQVVLDPTKIPIGQHNFRYKYTDGNGCIAYSAGYPVEIFKLPTLTFSGLNTAYCIDNADVLLTARNEGSGINNDLSNVTFQISSNGGATWATSAAIVLNTGAETITFKPSSLVAGTYQVRFGYTDGNTCFDYSPAQTVTINPLPQPTFTIAGGVTAYCKDAASVALTLIDITTGTTLNDNAGGELERITFEIDKDQNGTYVSNNGEISIVPGGATAADRVMFNPATLAVLGVDANYNIRYTYTDANGCVKTSADLAIRINDLPAPVINGLTAGYCEYINGVGLTLQDDGANITINTATSNVVFQVDTSGTFGNPRTGSIVLSNGTNNVTLNPDKFPVGTHKIRYTYTDGNTCVQTSPEYQIEIYKRPTLTFSGLSAAYCIDNADVLLTARNEGTGINNDLTNVAFEISSNGGVTWATSAAIVLNTGAETITFKPSGLVAGSYKIRYQYTDGNTCVNYSPEQDVIIHPLPQPNFSIAGGVTSYCIDAASPVLTLRDDVTTLTAAQLNDVTFQIQRNQTGAYVANSGEISVDIANNKVTLNPSILGVPTVEGTPHNIRYVYTDGNTCVQTSVDMAITINPLPLPVINGLATGYCEYINGVGVTLQDEGSNITINTATSNVVFQVDTSGTFGNPRTGSIVLSNGTNNVTLNPDQFPIGTHKIRYTYTDGNGCMQTSPSYQIEIYKRPTLTFSGLNSTYCKDNADVLLTARNEGTGINNDLANVVFEISSDGGATWAASPAIVLNTTAETITFKPSSLTASTTYQIRYRYTDGNTCFSDSPIQTVTINPLPQPAFTIAGGVTAYCRDAASVALTLTDATTGTTLNDNAGGELSRVVFEIDKDQNGTYVTNNGEISIIPGGATAADRVMFNPSTLAALGVDATYNIRYTYTDANGCVQTSADLAIRINDLPAPVINGIDATGYCISESNKTLTLQDDGVNIIINTTTSNVVFETDISGTYATPPAGGIILNNGTNTVTLNPHQFPAGVHKIRYKYTDGNGCIAYSDNTVTFEVLSLPTLTFTGLDATYCNDAAVADLKAFNNGNPLAAPNGAFTLSTDGGTTFNANSAIDPATHKFDPSKLTPGIYWIRYEYTDASLCNNISPAQKTEIYFYPSDLDFTFTNTCFGDSVVFGATATGVTTGWKWEWTFGDGGTSNIQNPNHKFPTFAGFQVTLTATNQHGCSFTVQKTVTVTPVPTANFGSAGFCHGGTTQFTDQSTVSQPGQIVKWNWSFGDGSTSTLQNPTHTYAAPGTYTVTLNIETQGSITGCTDQITKTVYIFPYVTVTNTNNYFETFETNDGGWIPAGTNMSWQHGTPSGSTFDATSGNVWTTNLSGAYNNSEVSYVESPCFNIDGMLRPVINIKYWVNTDINFDGAVLLATLDDGVSWEVIGTVGAGIDWYNKTGILGNPGTQSAAQATWNGNIIGWAGDTDSTWKVAKYPLDAIKTRLDASTTDNLKTVRFRIAFSSDASNPIGSNLDGFAFDNVLIGERNRVAVLEHFTNSSNTDANTENDFINTFTESRSPEVVDIQYHTRFPGDDLLNQDNNAAPSARALYYGVAVTPRTVLDGATRDSVFSVYGVDDYSRRTLEASPFSISMDFSGSTPANLSVKATVNALNTVERPLIVQVVVIEKQVSGVGSTGLIFKNVVKKMLPSAAGTLVDWTAAKTSEVITQSWQLANIYNNNQVAVVVFVQDDETKEIYQAAIGDPTSFLRTNENTEDKEDKEITGIIDNLKHDFVVYPNPATTKVYVGYKSLSFTENTPFIVYDQLGRVIHSGLVPKGQKGVVINTELWSEGMYHIELTASDGSKLKSKLIKH